MLSRDLLKDSALFGTTPGGHVAKRSFVFALLVIAFFGASTARPQTAAQPAATPGSGDAARGKLLFTQTYRCYACHGYTAKTGAKRLVPMNFPQQAFIGFVQNSTLPQMPKFADVPANELADIYAYLKSIPPDTRSVVDVPLLRDIAAQRIKSH